MQDQSNPQTIQTPPTGGFPNSDSTTVTTTGQSDVNVSVTPPGQRKSSGGRIIATIFGLLLLVGGVGAGLLLVRQNQDIREKAAGATEVYCPNSNGPGTCILSNGKEGYCYAVDYWCPGGVTGGGCQQNGLTVGERIISSGFLGVRTGYAACGYEQVDMGCKADDTSGAETIPGQQIWKFYDAECTGGATPAPGATTPPGWQPCGSCPSTGGGDCFQKPDGSFNHPLNECQINDQGTCVWNPSLCGGGGAPAPTPQPKACGETCTSSSECRNPSTAGNPVQCVNGTCQNTSCIGKTVPGANCECSALNSCGQPCGSDVGLCGGGSTCRYIGGSSCVASTSTARTTYCVPESPLPSGWTVQNCVARDQGNSYVLNATGANPTVAEIQQACLPTTASCTGLIAYDTSWNLLSPAQLSALKEGDKVRFTVAGTTTSGVFDKARFTINGTLRPEVTGKRLSSADFYDEYTVPAGTTTFTVKAEIHHAALNQWY